MGRGHRRPHPHLRGAFRLWSMSVAFSADGAPRAIGQRRQDAEAVGRGHRRTRASAPSRGIDEHGSLSVAFSPDGTRALSSSGDNTMINCGTRPSGALIAHPRRACRCGRFGCALGRWPQDRVRELRYDHQDSGRRDRRAARRPSSAAADGQWLAMTPAGFFASSREISKLLAIVRGLEVTTIDQVHQSLFNPDLVREALARDPSNEIEGSALKRRLQSLGESRCFDSRVQPHRRQWQTRRPSSGRSWSARLSRLCARAQQRPSVGHRPIGCPSVSLISLKRSRSSAKTAGTVPRSVPAKVRSSRLSQQHAIGQVGQRVMIMRRST